MTTSIASEAPEKKQPSKAKIIVLACIIVLFLVGICALAFSFFQGDYSKEFHIYTVQFSNVSHQDVTLTFVDYDNTDNKPTLHASMPFKPPYFFQKAYSSPLSIAKDKIITGRFPYNNQSMFILAHFKNGPVRLLTMNYVPSSVYSYIENKDTRNIVYHILEPIAQSDAPDAIKHITDKPIPVDQPIKDWLKENNLSIN